MQPSRSSRISLGFVMAILTASIPVACAQIPKINTFFPLGGKSGSSVEVELRGSSLEGANLLMIHGKGLTGTLAPGDAKVDDTNKPLWQGKCASCHELRSPANRSLTPGQWEATVERMVKLRSAPISGEESSKISAYLVSAARAGRVTAKLNIEPGTMPGIYEVRVATPRGISSPYWFEVSGITEVLAANVSRENAQPVTLPCVVNGCFMTQGERHFLRFAAKKDERFVFNLKAFRFNEVNQFFFSPNLRLYDASGRELMENHGYFDMDPLIDWVAPADSSYTLEVRDLLGRPNPASVYRLTMGRAPYDATLVPAVGTVGSQMNAAVAGKGPDALTAPFSLVVPADLGVINAPSPIGALPFLSTPWTVVRDDAPSGVGMSATNLPSAFAGTISKPGETDTFSIQGNGTFEFEGYASRLGSPVSLSVVLVNKAGAGIVSFGNDGRMQAKLEAGQTYQLRIANNSGAGGPNMVYAVEARPAKPGLEAVLRPDNITLRSGVGAVALVILTRREGIEGDVTVSAEDLPSGVTVSPVVLAPDRNIAWLRLTAAANASPVEKPIRVTVSARGPLGDVKVNAIPQEEFRLNNDPRYRPWSDAVVAVRGQADFTLEFVEPRTPIRVHPRKGTPVKVRIVRREGFKGNVTVFLSGLPQGWTANPEATTGNELTLTVRPDGNDTNPFLKREPKWAPIQATLEGSSDEFRFAFGVITVKRVDVISAKDD